ncbi:MAG: DUF4367 domain-containing protein [Clostridia bacterium]|nr:DUF4367 domain-containing protein [Clostridia bacterium]
MNKLARACELSLNDWFDTFPDAIPEAERSKKHEKWKKNLFNKMRDNHYHRFTTKTIKVMVIAATLCALLLTAFVIPSSREYIIDNFEIFSRYKIIENNKNSVNGEITVGYIPEGFELVEEGKYSKTIYSKFVSFDKKIFTINKYSSSIEVDFDTEYSQTEEIMVENIIYTYSVSESGMYNVMWIRNDYLYQIDGQLSIDELIKIAKTVN